MEPDQSSLPEEMLYEVSGETLVEKPTTAVSSCVANQLFRSFVQNESADAQGTFVVRTLFMLDRNSNVGRRPDVAFISHSTWPLGRSLPYHNDWKIAPNLAVEVAHRGTSFSKLAGKVVEYFRYGVNEVWILVPKAQQAYVYHSPRAARILGATDVLSTPQIRGWSICVGELLPLSLFESAAISAS